MRSLALVLVLVLAACQRDTGPSLDYADASRLWAEAVTQKGDDAIDDPRANMALELARKVPPESMDSDAARALIKRIEAARAERAAQKAEAAAPVAAPSAPPPGFGDAPSAPAAPAEPAGPALPAVGSAAAEFKAKYGACVTVASRFLEKGGTREGEAFALVDSDACREKHPELAGQYVFVLEDKIFNVAPASAATKLVPTDAGWVDETVDAGEVANP